MILTRANAFSLHYLHIVTLNPHQASRHETTPLIHTSSIECIALHRIAKRHTETVFGGRGGGKVPVSSKN